MDRLKTMTNGERNSNMAIKNEVLIRDVTIYRFGLAGLKLSQTSSQPLPINEDRILVFSAECCG